MLYSDTRLAAHPFFSQVLARILFLRAKGVLSAAYLFFHWFWNFHILKKCTVYEHCFWEKQGDEAHNMKISELGLDINFYFRIRDCKY